MEGSLGFLEAMALLSHRKALRKARTAMLEGRLPEMMERVDDEVEAIRQFALPRPRALDAFFFRAGRILDRKFRYVLHVDDQHMDPPLAELVHLVRSERFCTGAWNSALADGDIEDWFERLVESRVSLRLLALRPSGARGKLNGHGGQGEGRSLDD